MPLRKSSSRVAVSRTRSEGRVPEIGDKVVTHPRARAKRLTDFAAGGAARKDSAGNDHSAAGFSETSARRDRAVLRLHAALSMDDFRDALKGLVSELRCHSVEFIVDPLRFDPNLGHFCVRTNSSLSYTGSDWRRLLQISPFLLFFQTNGNAKIAWLTPLWPNEAAIADNDFFQEIMQPEGWRHAFAMGFRQGADLRATIVLRRGASAGDFTDRERRHMKRILYPNLQVAVNRILKFERERAKCRALEKVSTAGESPLLLLNWELSVIHSTSSARDLCARWNFGEEQSASVNSTQAFRLPSEIENACFRLKLDYEKANHELCPPELGEETEVFTARDECLSARVRRLRPNRGYQGKPVFEVMLGCYSRDEKTLSPAAAMLAGKALSPAEREVVRQVCKGLSNQEISTRLGKSPDTVKKQLGSVFRKLKVSSRTRLVALFS